MPHRKVFKMYFDSFPKVEYSNVINGEKKVVTNILRRIATRQAVKSNLTFFSKYTIGGNESPENLAFDLYGDAELHWVILLTNDIYDRYHQWPMNNNQFNASGNGHGSNHNGNNQF